MKRERKQINQIWRVKYDLDERDDYIDHNLDRYDEISDSVLLYEFFMTQEVAQLRVNELDKLEARGAFVTEGPTPIDAPTTTEGWVDYLNANQNSSCGVQFTLKDWLESRTEEYKERERLDMERTAETVKEFRKMKALREYRDSVTKPIGQ
jgi:hypothetical protein